MAVEWYSRRLRCCAKLLGRDHRSARHASSRDAEMRVGGGGVARGGGGVGVGAPPRAPAPPPPPKQHPPPVAPTCRRVKNHWLVVPARGTGAELVAVPRFAVLEEEGRGGGVSKVTPGLTRKACKACKAKTCQTHVCLPASLSLSPPPSAHLVDVSEGPPEPALRQGRGVHRAGRLVGCLAGWMLGWRLHGGWGQEEEEHASMSCLSACSPAPQPRALPRHGFQPTPAPTSPPHASPCPL